MSKEKNKDRHCLYLEISYSCNGKEYHEIKVYHFITKVTENRLNVYGASYAVCHYNGNLPTHKWMRSSSLETRSLYHFVYKLNLRLI